MKKELAYELSGMNSELKVLEDHNSTTAVCGERRNFALAIMWLARKRISKGERVDDLNYLVQNCEEHFFDENTMIFY